MFSVVSVRHSVQRVGDLGMSYVAITHDADMGPHCTGTPPPPRHVQTHTVGKQGGSHPTGMLSFLVYI